MSKGDHITITLWNHRKINKKNIQKPVSGFLGCVRLSWNQIQKHKDTGCKYTIIKYPIIFCYNYILVMYDL